MSPSISPVVSLDRVSKVFGTLAVLRAVSCELEAGRGYLVLGENGAGKSTLLRLVAGLSEPTAGTVLVLGEPPRDVRERIGYMSHDSMLYDELTAAENLRYYGRLYPAGQCVGPDQALASVGLPAALDRHVGKYSQGMRQRVSLARVLMTQPQLLLLDEPFSNMDRASALQMVDRLALLKQAGCTLLLTTHQPELAAPLADITWFLRGGSLTADAGASQ
jgi:heme ABC exporter ATP-binding subunit CcmA